jgi:predicted RND superfamily exporter protein
MGSLADFIYRRSRLVLVFIGILTVAALASLSRFEVDPDFLILVAQTTPEAEQYNDLNEKYGQQESIAILVEHAHSLLAQDSLVSIIETRREIEEIDGVSDVQSYIPGEMILNGQLVPIDEQLIQERYTAVLDFIENRYFYADQLLSTDESSAVMVASLSLDASAADVVKSLQDLAEKESDLELSFAGDEIVRDELSKTIRTTLYYLPPLAVGLILLVFIFVIRSVRLTLLAILPAVITVLWSYGTILWSGHKLDAVNSIAPIFILVLGTVYGLHFISHFIDSSYEHTGRQRIIRATLGTVGWPIVLATLTTMAGFAALTWTDIYPVKTVGLFTTIGIFFAGFLTLVLLPALLSIVTISKMPPRVSHSRVARLVVATSKHRIPIIAVFLVIVGVSAFYIPRVEVVSHRLMYFKEGSQIITTYGKLENNFDWSFSLVGELAVDGGITALGDQTQAHNVLAVERDLESLPFVGSAYSAYDLIKGANLMISGRDEYPEDLGNITGLASTMSPEYIASWISPDGFRLVVRTEELRSDDISELNGFLEDHGDTIRTITGIPVLLDNMNKAVTQSQIRSVSLAFGLIFIILLVTLRNLRAAVAGLLPIVITVLGILGFLALSKIHLHFVTAILSAISIGVGVDYCIHVLLGIYSFRREGAGYRESVDRALSVVSGPVIANALGITIGLCTLFLAPLKLHADVAAVLSLAMMLSAMGALLLIPQFYSTEPKHQEKH